MKYIKKFDRIFSPVDIKVSEANKIKSLPGFNFSRYYSGVSGCYYLKGKRNHDSMEYIDISKEGN